MKLTQYWICFSNSCIDLFARLPSLVNTIPWYLKFSICCIVLPLTCSIHWLGSSERHNTSAFSVFIFVPVWSYATTNQPSTCWRLHSKDRSSTKSFANGRQLILQVIAVMLSSTRLIAYPVYIDQWFPNDGAQKCSKGYTIFLIIFTMNF